MCLGFPVTCFFLPPGGTFLIDVSLPWGAGVMLGRVRSGLLRLEAKHIWWGPCRVWWAVAWVSASRCCDYPSHVLYISNEAGHTAKAIPFIYSFSGNTAASAPVSTFMCLWAIYISPGSVHIFRPAEKAGPSSEYIIRSQTHECGNWDCGPNIPFLGIFVSNFRHFFFAVQGPKLRSAIIWPTVWKSKELHDPSKNAQRYHTIRNFSLKLFIFFTFLNLDIYTSEASSD